ncbi:MAG: hypothetical protein Q9183_006285, partial [Haloplaca sp. 2 TL-2023]
EFETDKANSLINTVNVIKRIESIGDDDEAKEMAYAWQLWTESQVAKEIERLDREAGLGVEEWVFVDACLVAAAGSGMAAVTMKRYGGEASRIVRA